MAVNKTGVEQSDDDCFKAACVAVNEEVTAISVTLNFKAACVAVNGLMPSDLIIIGFKAACVAVNISVN